MIVKCPECQTGFNLSPEKVPAKGAKLRCSRCDHLFRVRITDGRPEIFYKNQTENVPSVAANNETQIGGLHRQNNVEIKRETEKLSTMDSGGQTTFGAPSRTGTQPRQRGQVPLIPPKVKALPVRAPILTPPGIDRRLEAEKPPKPLTTPSRRKLTPVPSEELDLFGDDSGFNFSNNDRSVEDPFYGAFDEPEEELFSPKVDEFDLGEQVKSDYSDYSHQGNSWVEESPEFENEIPVGTSSEDFFSRGGSTRNYDELTPPLTKSPPEIPQNSVAPPIEASLIAPPKPAKPAKPVKKAEPKLKLAIERAPIKPTRSNIDEGPRSKKGKKREVSEPKREAPIALKPHKIGGNSFRRLFDTLFIGFFLLGSFIAVVAYKTGGFFDFSAPLHMLEVAFEGKPYELNPRLKVKSEKQKTTKVVGSKPYVNNLIATPYRLQSKDYALLVNGFINNPGPETKAKAVLIEISSSAGKNQSEVHIGEALSISQLKARLDEQSFSTLPNLDTLTKNSNTPFFVVFRSPVRFRDLEIKTKIISK